jgi:uncharacterized protein YpuA (DUF1002 family)
MKKMISAITMVFAVSVLSPTMGSANVGINEKFGLPIAVFGGDLSAAEKDSVAKSLEVTGEVEEIEVTGQDLVKYIKDGDSRARMYSSAKITRQDEGKGMVVQIVTPDNITQVTTDMYANAMLTAGIKDATVEVAAPKPVTGHSALVGIYKAYEVNGGEELDPERTDVANDELGVATEIADSGVEEAKVSELLTEIKKDIAEQKPETREEVEKIVEEQIVKLQIELSPEDRKLLVDLMDRISNLDIDFSQWTTELNDISKTIEDKISTIAEDDGFWQGVKNFFNKLIDGIRGLMGQ